MFYTYVRVNHFHDISRDAVGHLHAGRVVEVVLGVQVQPYGKKCKQSYS